MSFTGDPTWSPDGSKVAYLADVRGNFEVFAVALDFGVPEQVTFHPANEFSPAWSPDGSLIAFASDRTGASEIWVTQVE